MSESGQSAGGRSVRSGTSFRPGGQGKGKRHGAPGKTAEAQPSRRKAVSARELALDILVKVARTGAYSNLQLHHALQKNELSRADAGLATELVYGTISRQATLDYWLRQYTAKGLSRLEAWVHQLLRLSAYQLLYLDRIPAHAAVNEAVSIAKRRGHAGISGMVNGVLRNLERNRGALLPAAIETADPIETIALRHSYPEWLVARWVDMYGPRTAEQICAAGNEPPRATIRVNSLLADRDQLLALLRAEGVEAEPSPLAPSGIVVMSGGNLAEQEGFRQGRWSIQDESSMLVAEAVNPAPGAKVLDCCAAPGGKSAHLAELMEGKGKVWANDLHPHKRASIVAQSERLKLRNIEAVTGDAAQLGERFAAEWFDAVLLDAPCTGFGVIRRKPEIKWSKTEADIAAIAEIQSSLLDAVCGLVKPGGALVYSTCTMEARENGDQVAGFLARHPEFRLDASWPERILTPLRAAGVIDDSFDGQLQLLPQHFGSDGFYIARMIRVP